MLPDLLLFLLHLFIFSFVCCLLSGLLFSVHSTSNTKSLKKVWYNHFLRLKQYNFKADTKRLSIMFFMRIAYTNSGLIKVKFFKSHTGCPIANGLWSNWWEWNYLKTVLNIEVQIGNAFDDQKDRYYNSRFFLEGTSYGHLVKWNNNKNKHYVSVTTAFFNESGISWNIHLFHHQKHYCTDFDFDI